MKDPNSVVTYTFTFLCLEHEKFETHPRYRKWLNWKSLRSRFVTDMSYSETLEGININSHGQAVQEVTFFLLGQGLSAPRLWIAPISIKKADVKL